MGKRITAGAARTRRRFLLAGGASVAAVAMPQASRAQDAVWRFQSAWSAKDIFHEFALDYAARIDRMTAGRLKLDVLPAGAVVPPFQMQDAVHAGVIDGAHGVCDLWYRKHRAAALFSSPPSFGWDAHGLLAWFYQGGGEALYRELVNDILKLNVVGLLSFPMPTQPLGWFKRQIGGPADLKAVRYRIDGLAADMFRELGAAITTLPTGEIVPVMDRGLLDAAAVNNPSSDLALGLPDVAKFYMMGSHHRQAAAFEISFNKTKHDALPPDLQSILRNAALAASTEQLGVAYVRYAKDMATIERRGVKIDGTAEELLDAQLAAWDKVIAKHSKDRFFAKVIASQKTWMKQAGPYLHANNLSTAQRAAAFRHFIG